VLEEWEGGATAAQNVWSPVYVDALVLRDRGGERLYVQQDANFNVTALIDTTGAVVERYVYDPYGSAGILAPDWSTRDVSSFGWLYLHQGGRLDPGTGLYHFRLREFSPLLGRWLQQDPLGYVDGLNLYQYVNDNPVNYRDPTGQAFWLLVIVVAVVVILPLAGSSQPPPPPPPPPPPTPPPRREPSPPWKPPPQNPPVETPAIRRREPKPGELTLEQIIEGVRVIYGPEAAAHLIEELRRQGRLPRSEGHGGDHGHEPHVPEELWDESWESYWYWQRLRLRNIPRGCPPRR
jgi:RHS repeat-associated protein